MDKPTAFLRHIGRPDYVHIVANGASWLFLADGHSAQVWSEARKAGYELVGSDVSGEPSQDEIRDCLEQALCIEEEPLNTRRKVTHSRGLFGRPAQDNSGDESNCSRESGNMNGSAEKGSPKWDTEVLMQPIQEVAKELEAQGWRIVWQSEVEALAVKGEAARVEDIDIVELIENHGVKLKKTGKEYTGLCPFHDDHEPSLSVNREKGLWHCFGCQKGGDYSAFVDEWQKLADQRRFRPSAEV